jgi:hypothetical protein
MNMLETNSQTVSSKNLKLITGTGADPVCFNSLPVEIAGCSNRSPQNHTT